MSSNFSTREWESRSELMKHLSRGGAEPNVIAVGVEAPRRFYSICVERQPAAWEVGVLLSYGVAPSLVFLQQEERALLGHDSCVTWLDAKDGTQIVSHNFVGAFYEFIMVDKRDQAVVLHEIGASRVDANGSVLWSVAIDDIVGGWRVGPKGALVLSRWEDGREVAVDLESGRVLSGEGRAF